MEGAAVRWGEGCNVEGWDLVSLWGREDSHRPSDWSSVVCVEEEFGLVLEDSASWSSVGWLADISRRSLSLALLTCSCRLSITAFFWKLPWQTYKANENVPPDTMPHNGLSQTRSAKLQFYYVLAPYRLILQVFQAWTLVTTSNVCPWTVSWNHEYCGRENSTRCNLRKLMQIGKRQVNYVISLTVYARQTHATQPNTNMVQVTQTTLLNAVSGGPYKVMDTWNTLVLLQFVPLRVIEIHYSPAVSEKKLKSKFFSLF